MPYALLIFQSYIRCKHVDYCSQKEEAFYDIQLNLKGKKNGEYGVFHRQFLERQRGKVPLEPRHAKRAFRVILIKMLIFLFSECTLF